MKFNFTIAADVRAYAVLSVEAGSEDEATERAKAIAASRDIFSAPEMAQTVFDVAYDTLEGFELLDGCDLVEDRAAQPHT